MAALVSSRLTCPRTRTWIWTWLSTWRTASSRAAPVRHLGCYGSAPRPPISLFSTRAMLRSRTAPRPGPEPDTTAVGFLLRPPDNTLNGSGSGPGPGLGPGPDSGALDQGPTMAPNHDEPAASADERKEAGGSTRLVPPLGAIPPGVLRQMALAPLRSDSALVRPFAVYPHPAETHRSWGKHRRTVLRQSPAFCAKFGLRAVPDPDWRGILLAMLQAAAPSSILPSSSPRVLASDSSGSSSDGGSSMAFYTVGACTASVSHAAALALLHGVDDTIWDIAEATGCHLAAVPPSAPHRRPAHLWLSGRPAAVARARTALTALCTRLATDPPHFSDRLPNGGAKVPSTRFDTTHLHPPPPRRPLSTRSNIRLETEPMPETADWASKATVLDYLHRLNKIILSPFGRHTLYPGRGAVQTAVLQLLHHVVARAAEAGGLSAAAVRAALALCNRYHVSVDQMQRLVRQCETTAGIVPDARILNAFVHRARAHASLPLFAASIGLQRAHAVAPDWDSWRCLLQLLRRPADKFEVVAALAKHRLLCEPRLLTVVAEELTPLLAARTCHTGAPLAAFLQRQTALFGSRWITNHAAMAVVEVLAAHGRLHDSLAFLHHAHRTRHPLKLDAVPFAIVMYHARLHARPDLVLAALRAHERALRWDLAHSTALDPAVPPPRRLALRRSQFYELVQISVRCRLPNLLEVAWVAACRAGAVSRRLWHRLRPFFSYLHARRLDPAYAAVIAPSCIASALSSAPAPTLTPPPPPPISDSNSDPDPDATLHFAGPPARPVLLPTLFARIIDELVVPSLPLPHTLAPAALVLHHRKYMATIIALTLRLAADAPTPSSTPTVSASATPNYIADRAASAFRRDLLLFRRWRDSPTTPIDWNQPCADGNFVAASRDYLDPRRWAPRLHQPPVADPDPDLDPDRDADLDSDADDDEDYEDEDPDHDDHDDHDDPFLPSRFAAPGWAPVP